MQLGNETECNVSNGLRRWRSPDRSSGDIGSTNLDSVQLATRLASIRSSWYSRSWTHSLAVRWECQISYLGVLNLAEYSSAVLFVRCTLSCKYLQSKDLWCMFGLCINASVSPGREVFDTYLPTVQLLQPWVHSLEWWTVLNFVCTDWVCRYLRRFLMSMGFVARLCVFGASLPPHCPAKKCM
jgi:hypothetical protein